MFHITNIILHLVNVLLLIMVLSRMTGSFWRSAFVGALFALHPQHVESVAWISERKDVLSTLFWMLTMLAYLRYKERQGLPGVLLTLAFVAGLASKPMLVSLPIALLLLGFWLLRSFEPGHYLKLNQREAAPFALAAAACIITLFAQKEGGAVVSLKAYPPWVRLDNALVAYVAYVRKMFWPQDLAAFYPHPNNLLPSWQVAGSALALACATVFAIRCAPAIGLTSFSAGCGTWLPLCRSSGLCRSRGRKWRTATHIFRSSGCSS